LAFGSDASGREPIGKSIEPLECGLPSAEDSNYNSHSGLAEDRLASGWPLGPRASARLDDDHSLGEAFLLAGLTVLQSRLFHQASVTIAAGHRVRTFPFAPDSPFSSILPTVSDDRTFLDVDEVLDNASAVDASLEVIFDGDAEALVPARAYPVFCAQRASQSGAWRISLRNVPHAEAERMLHYLATLLESAARDPHQAAGSLPMLSEAEALDLYRVINATEAPHQLELITDLITQQAQIDPSADAVVFDGVPLTYAALEDESSRLSIVLSRMGADQNHPVVLAMPRSQQVPIVLLAALKAGSFFVPLDSTHPQQRLADILDECKPAVVVVTPATEPLFVDKTLPILVLGGSAAETAVPLAPMTRSLDDKAYTIYTSGTTGKPKGVMVPQRALLNFVTAAQREPGLKRGDRMLAVATLSFDMSIMDMFLPLATGAAIVIASEQDARDPALLAQLIERERITCMQATPTTWRMLLSHGWRGKKCLRMLAGGEVLPRDLANDLIRLDVDPAGEGCGELWNCYGPTETTVYSSFLRIHAGDGLVPIGPPIANTTFYIADTDGKLLPPEVAGELYIGGDGVALGYFERPELNRQKFIANPWTGNTPQLLFRTGDRAQLRPDGNFDFFGRLDQQVKLRGYRIELGEIETVLRTYPSVADAAVVLREDATGEPWLVAYVISRGDFDAMALRAHAAKSLPDYMLPARFVLLPELPLTGSGKVDKRALQERPAPEEIATKTGAEKPADAVEAALLKVFREVLRSPSFGLDDSFFDHGGYSLLAVRLFARIANTLGTELPITALFDAPTVRALSVLLREGQSLATIVPLRAGGEKTAILPRPVLPALWTRRKHGARGPSDIWPS
jgi:amino acid adenylation domain-containing protein